MSRNNIANRKRGAFDTKVASVERVFCFYSHPESVYTTGPHGDGYMTRTGQVLWCVWANRITTFYGDQFYVRC